MICGHATHAIQCCLPPSRGDIPAFTPAKLVLDLVTVDGCKVELTYSVVGWLPHVAYSVTSVRVLTGLNIGQLRSYAKRC